jgi:transposase
VGIEATGPIHWFERLLAELGHELWIGDSAKIRASEVRKQKTDERDAALILDLLLGEWPRRKSGGFGCPTCRGYTWVFAFALAVLLILES